MQRAIFGSSWQTSLAGYISAIALALIPILQTGQIPSLEQMGVAAAVAILGRFAKDHNVTGAGK
jgi:hypothetical protein